MYLYVFDDGGVGVGGDDDRRQCENNMNRQRDSERERENNKTKTTNKYDQSQARDMHSVWISKLIHLFWLWKARALNRMA